MNSYFSKYEKFGNSNPTLDDVKFIESNVINPDLINAPFVLPEDNLSFNSEPNLIPNDTNGSQDANKSYLSKLYENLGSNQSLNNTISSDKQFIIDKINSRTDIDDAYKQYLIKLAGRESSFNPNENSSAYKGLFQMGESALKDINMSESDYMSNVDNQIEAAIRFTNRNKETLKQLINDSSVNLYGLLGGAHLGGATGVKKFINSGYNPSDKLGTSIKDYYEYFSQ